MLSVFSDTVNLSLFTLSGYGSYEIPVGYSLRPGSFIMDCVKLLNTRLFLFMDNFLCR